MNSTKSNFLNKAISFFSSNITVYKLYWILILCIFFESFIPRLSSGRLALIFVTTIATAFVAILTKRKILLPLSYNLAYGFFCLWIALSAISIIWAYNTHFVNVFVILAIQYSFYFFLFSQLINSQKRLELSIYGIVVVFSIYALVAMWEMITWHHLPQSRFSALPFPVPIPTGPFYNENNLASAFLLFLPFITNIIPIAKSVFLKVWLFICILAMIVSITIGGARIAIIMFLLYSIYCFLFKTSLISKAKFIALLILIVLFSSIFFPTYSKLFFDYLSLQLTSINTEGASYTLGSIEIRKRLLTNGLDLLESTYFVGVGAGNFDSSMLGWRNYETGMVINPHSFFLELLVNYGVLFFLLFCLLYSAWAFMLLNRALKLKGKFKHYYIALFESLLMFIPASVLPSSIRAYFFIWVFFAIIHSAAFPLTSEENLNKIEDLPSV